MGLAEGAVGVVVGVERSLVGVGVEEDTLVLVHAARTLVLSARIISSFDFMEKIILIVCKKVM